MPIEIANSCVANWLVTTVNTSQDRSFNSWVNVGSRSSRYSVAPKHGAITASDIPAAVPHELCRERTLGLMPGILLKKLFKPREYIGHKIDAATRM